MNICNGSGIPTWNGNSSRDLVLYILGTSIYALIIEISFAGDFTSHISRYFHNYRIHT